jgi:hypothetical protein
MSHYVPENPWRQEGPAIRLARPASSFSVVMLLVSHDQINPVFQIVNRSV